MKATNLITAFVIGILGIILVGIIAAQSNTNTFPTQVTGEALSIASLRVVANNLNNSNNVTLTNLGLKDAGGWVTDSVVLKNSSGTVIVSNNYTVDYTAQKIVFLNTTYMVQGAGVNVNTTYADYQYYPANYLTQSWGRNVSNMTSGFLALLILVGIIALLYTFLKVGGNGN